MPCKLNLVVFLKLLIFHSIITSECTTEEFLCKEITSKSKELELKNRLFCDYDSDVRPENENKNATKVGIMIVPQIIEFVSIEKGFSNISSIY